MKLLHEIVTHADEHLRIREMKDWPNALNGLQLENDGSVTRIGAAVDASVRTFAAAAERGVDLLVVHHGLFWPGVRPITGGFRTQLHVALARNLALYSVHLPLDLHPTLGNNARLAAALHLTDPQPFLEAKGELVGLKFHVSIPREELVRRLEALLTSGVKSFAFGPEKTRVVGLATGGAGAEIYEAQRAGVDTFITGEAPHWAAIAAEELQMNLLLGGHYATETFGVKALAAHLAEQFRLPWEFIESATAL